MKHLLILINAILICLIIGAFGCASSEESSDKKESPPPPPTVQQQTEKSTPKAEPQPIQKVDTIDIDVQNTQKPTYESNATDENKTPVNVRSEEMPVGQYSIQIGVFKMPDNADRAVALLKERFNIKVYTVLDKTDDTYKVLLGDFSTKEEARNFRDEIVKKFPDDYKGAWVFENQQK